MRSLHKNGRFESEHQQTNAGVSMTTFIPVRFDRHKAKKVIIEPTTGRRLATPIQPGQAPTVDDNLMKALGRSLYWQRLLDEGKVASINALAAAEGGDKVRVYKMLKLARLAPEIVEDIARCRQPVGLSLEFFLRNPLPDDWEEQHRVIAARVK